MADNEAAINLRTAYDQVCTTYHAIDDFRAKLLGFLPLVTGTGVVVLTGERGRVRLDFLTPIGVFGIAVTAGLLAYELFGIRKCAALLAVGAELEHRLRLPVNHRGEVSGQFVRRPNNLLGVVNEPFAAATIYPAVLAAWTYLAFHGQPGPVASAAVFVAGFVAILLYDFQLRRRARQYLGTGRPLTGRRDGASGTPVPDQLEPHA